VIKSLIEFILKSVEFFNETKFEDVFRIYDNQLEYLQFPNWLQLKNLTDPNIDYKTAVLCVSIGTTGLSGRFDDRIDYSNFHSILNALTKKGYVYSLSFQNTEYSYNKIQIPKELVVWKPGKSSKCVSNAHDIANAAIVRARQDTRRSLNLTIVDYNSIKL
jgi:hypothetical protein